MPAANFSRDDFSLVFPFRTVRTAVNFDQPNYIRIGRFYKVYDVPEIFGITLHVTAEGNGKMKTTTNPRSIPNIIKKKSHTASFVKTIWEYLPREPVRIRIESRPAEPRGGFKNLEPDNSTSATH